MADLAVRGLGVRLEGRPILERCEALFPARKRTVLWGPSGAGKSTLLAAIAGLVTPDDGEIDFGSQSLFSKARGIDLPPHERKIGFVFQDLALWPHLRSIDQLRLTGAANGLDAERAAALLASVGLSGLERRRPGELSGGEQQRLAIARALAVGPEILLLDEPFSAVDQRTRAALRDLLRGLSGSIEGPTIYVTHDVADARDLAEYVVSLEEGMLVSGASL